MNLFPGLWGQLKGREPWAIVLVTWLVVCGPVVYLVMRVAT